MNGISLYSTDIKLANGIKLRKEYFGGLVFDTRNGNILELDKEAFAVLSVLKHRFISLKNLKDILLEFGLITKTDDQLDILLQTFVKQGIIEFSNETRADFLASPRNGSSYQEINDTISYLKKTQKYQWLSAPETVHWSITYRCNKSCPDCYTRRFRHDKPEMSTKEAKTFIDKIAGWGVFQLAIGGGEPFLRKDLPEIIKCAAGSYLTVHITTGKRDIKSEEIKPIAAYIKNLQIGFHPWEFQEDKILMWDKNIRNTIDILNHFSVSFGANLFLSKPAIQDLNNIIDRLVALGFSRIILLRYKPPADVRQWNREKPTREQLLLLNKKIINIKKRHPEINLRIDCALSFIQPHLPEELSRQLGQKGCVAASRILSVAPDGSVYPCSQLVHPQNNAGNLLNSNPVELWNNSGILRKYRSFRSKKSFLNSWCGVCIKKETCGGCRIFSPDLLGGEKNCPEPQLPPLNRIGKRGRLLDVKRYLNEVYEITAKEYMKRYDVGSKTAIKELNFITGMSNKSIHSLYSCSKEDTIRDIQESIGFTSNGVPYASYEEIKEWITVDEDNDYYV